MQSKLNLLSLNYQYSEASLFNSLPNDLKIIANHTISSYKIIIIIIVINIIIIVINITAIVIIIFLYI